MFKAKLNLNSQIQHFPIILLILSNLDQIEEYLFRVREEHPKIVSIIEIGRTYENRSVKIINLTTKSIFHF